MRQKLNFSFKPIFHRKPEDLKIAESESTEGESTEETVNFLPIWDKNLGAGKALNAEEYLI